MGKRKSHENSWSEYPKAGTAECVRETRGNGTLVTSCLCAILVPSLRAKVAAAAAAACVIKVTHHAGLGSNVLHYTTLTVPPFSV